MIIASVVVGMANLNVFWACELIGINERPNNLAELWLRVMAGVSRRLKEKRADLMVVSVICTNYNKGTWIEDAIRGILNQEGPFELELIIADDASTDCSPDIIRSYAERYPQQVKTIFHEDNQGIVKTWLGACEEATGAYIARCDGDDYWTDSHKLEKQVAALEASSDSKWCSTDFDIVSGTGEVTDRAALANGIIPQMTSFEKMLAWKGFTMSSTWLVERNLMLEANHAISLDAVDDTFNLQLELFMRTKLTTLMESMVAYRVVTESDSHSFDIERASLRNDRLEQTRLEYLNKNKHIDLPLLTRLLLEKDGKRDLVLIQQSGDTNRLLMEQASAYDRLCDELKAENLRIRDELTAENKRIYEELTSMVRDLQSQLQQVEAERDTLRKDLEAVTKSKRWVMASKAADILDSGKHIVSSRKKRD